MFEKTFPMNHYQNVIQFSKIHKTFFQINVHFWEKKLYLFVYVIESTLRINFIFFDLDKN